METESAELAKRATIEQLARRYGDLVYAAALRQIGDAHDAADVMQAVFVVAMRKAELPKEAAMAGWLLTVTRFAVKEAHRAAVRRAYHERRAAREREESTPSAKDGAELFTHLDEAILALPAMDREIVVRRYLQGNPVEEVARAVGISENAASQRIHRALEKLNRWFISQGRAVSADVLTAAMSAQAAVHAPAGIWNVAGSGAESLVQSAVVNRLVKATLWSMVMSKAQWLVLAGAVVLAIGTGVGFWAIHSGVSPSEPGVQLSEHDQYSPQVTAVKQEHSDALLKEVLAGLQENRAKLKTLHVAGVLTYQMYDFPAKRWLDLGELVKGEAWEEVSPTERERVEMEFIKAIWTDKAIWADSQVTFDQSYVAVWDGKRTRKLITGSRIPEDPPKLIIAGVRDLMNESSITGSTASAALARVEGAGADNLKVDDYELSPEALKWPVLRARRVMLDGHQDAVELELRVDMPQFPQAKLNFKFYWFDEKRGYAMLGYQEGTDGKPLYQQKIVDELKEVAPGVFYPTKSRGSIYDGEQEQSRWAVTLSQADANQPIPEERFTLEIPTGARVEYSPLHYASKPAVTAGTTLH